MLKPGDQTRGRSFNGDSFRIRALFLTPRASCQTLRFAVMPVPDNIRSLERPHPDLLKYYFITALFTGPGIVASLPYLFFRYHTLRYRFDDEGIHMKVGILFRREINLTYARIQDIHLRSGILQRWLGLANVQIQTASGSAVPER